MVFSSYNAEFSMIDVHPKFLPMKHEIDIPLLHVCLANMYYCTRVRTIEHF